MHDIPPQSAVAADLDLPLHGADFTRSVTRFFRKYARFSGRASRSEYWWAVLFQTVVGTVVGVVLSIVVVIVVVGVVARGGGSDPERLLVDALVASAWVVAIGIAVTVLPLLLPSIAVTVRRLHDTNRSGWWYLISLVPFGGYVVYAFAALESDPAGVRFDRPQRRVRRDSGSAPPAG